MCIATPMKVEEILDAHRAIASQEDFKTEIDLALVEKVQVGDYVIVHAGFAIEVLDMDEARERLDLFEQIARHERGIDRE